MRSAVMVTLQLAPLVLSQPLQLPNVEPAAAEAVRTTALPESSDALQVAPQLITPPAPVTVPDPLPSFCTLSVYTIGLKVAVTMRSVFTVTLQVAPLVLSQPTQPANVEPTSANAVSVAGVPKSSDALQVAPQLIAPPAPVTVPDPVPLLCTVSVY